MKVMTIKKMMTNTSLVSQLGRLVTFLGMDKRWIFSVVLAAVVAFCAFGCAKETEKFEKKIKATVNPDELQAWATNVIATAHFHGGDSVVIKESDIPKWVGSIYKKQGDPGKVTVERSTEHSYVQVSYGSGFGHWGLAIGDSTLVLTNHDSCLSHPWKPGIYFWSCQ
jgi:hypothetical protein